MEPIGIGVLALAAAAPSLWAAHKERRRQGRRIKLRRDLRDADQRIASQHRQARRAMNDAAGQSWRNLAE